MLPGFVLMFALSWVYLRFGLKTEGVAAVFAAVQVAVAALIVRAVFRIGGHVVTNRWLWGIAIIAAAAHIAGVHFGLILVGGGLIYFIAHKGHHTLAFVATLLGLAAVVILVLYQGSVLENTVVGTLGEQAGSKAQPSKE